MIALGLAGLFFGGEWLVRGSSRLARSFGIPPLIIGLTVVAFGTSAPELMVSLSAALGASSDIALGNVIGSNIANIGLILGLSALLFPIVVHIELVRREIPIMIVLSAATALMMGDGEVSRLDGLLLLAGFVGFNLLMYRETMRERQANQLSDADLAEGAENSAPINRLHAALLIVVGIALLVAGARLTVDNAVILARSVGVSELFIGLTLVAVGTSLPELATSLVAALRRQNDIAVGNVIGSNGFNLLLILGMTAVVRPVPASAEVIAFDAPIMVGFALLALLFAANQRVSRWEAGALLAAYVGFTVVAFLR
ncbi:MAG: calcium/sodium antiporter [Aggregatilineales bacterium]